MYSSCINLTDSHIDELEYDVSYIDLSRSVMDASYFNHNNLKLRIDANIFKGGDNFNYASLNHNEIVRLPSNLFVCLPNLIQLDLCNCSLISIEHGAFNGLVNLKNLWLMHNDLRRIDTNIFQGLHNVEEIFMHTNKNLSSVTSKLCIGLNKLVKLDMSGSSLRSINLDVLNGLPNFKCLVIRSYFGSDTRGSNEAFITSATKSNKYKFSIC